MIWDPWWDWDVQSRVGCRAGALGLDGNVGTRRKVESPHCSSCCFFCLWEMERGSPRQKIQFQSPCLQCLPEWGKMALGEGAVSVCSQLFPSIISQERESPALQHRRCLLAAVPGPKSPAAPNLMDHHGNGGAAPHTSGERGSEVCGAGI